jgi:hypothetical protein
VKPALFPRSIRWPSLFFDVKGKHQHKKNKKQKTKNKNLFLSRAKEDCLALRAQSNGQYNRQVLQDNVRLGRAKGILTLALSSF